MSERADSKELLEVSISHLLRAGAFLSATLLAGGWLMDAMGRQAGESLTEAGIHVLISTPIARVCATFVLFVRQRDALYAIITAIVLIFLAIGVVGGLHL